MLPCFHYPGVIYLPQKAPRHATPTGMLARPDSELAIAVLWTSIDGCPPTTGLASGSDRGPVVCAQVPPPNRPAGLASEISTFSGAITDEHIDGTLMRSQDIERKGLPGDETILLGHGIARSARNRKLNT